MGILDRLKELARGKEPELGETQPWQRSITAWLFETKVKQPIKGVASGINTGLNKILLIGIVGLIIFMVANAYIKKNI